ncbi:MAG: peptidase S16 [Burkholderiales bacterium PBB4]|nr:MAG: peptidase S16 [Burkholderiales bacterium PBB4]
MTDVLKLTSLPLFPLGTVLFPGGILPLQIFEVRYLDMVGKAFKAGAPFGVVLLTQGTEVRKPTPQGNSAFAQEAFHAVGTLATIAHLESPQAGLMVIQCTGTQRFEVTRSEQLRHGLWIADVHCRVADLAVEIPPDLRAAAAALQQLIQNLKNRNPQASTPPVLEPYRLNDCGWVANRWCELLPIPPDLKQRLMALDNPLVRLELVHDILQKTGIAT